MPAQSFLEGDSGTVIVPIEQYGIKVGMSNASTFIKKGEVGKDFTHGPHVEGEDNELSDNSGNTPKYTVFFEYRMSDCGMFMVFCEVVDEEELDEILADLEAELNDDTEEDNLNEESNDEHFEKQSKKMQGAINLHLRKGKSYEDAVKSAKVHVKEETINELSPELVGKVSKERFKQETGLSPKPKKAQTSAAAKTLARAAKKKWLGSNVGVLKT
jgi:hypothetical protein